MKAFAGHIWPAGRMLCMPDLKCQIWVKISRLFKSFITWAIDLYLQHFVFKSFITWAIDLYLQHFVFKVKFKYKDQFSFCFAQNIKVLRCSEANHSSHLNGHSPHVVSGKLVGQRCFITIQKSNVIFQI